MQNQKKPIQQKKPMQNFTAEKWADKIALFIDNFGFLSGFFWHWTIALPSPTSHLAMLHSKIILSDPNRRVKVVLIGFSLFWSRCRTWGSCGTRWTITSQKCLITRVYLHRQRRPWDQRQDWSSDFNALPKGFELFIELPFYIVVNSISESRMQGPQGKPSNANPKKRP